MGNLHIKRRIIIFEPENEGHQAEYISYLVRYAIDQRQDCIIHLAISNVLFDRLGEDVRHALMTERAVCDWHQITAADLNALNTPVLWRRGLCRWRYVTRLVEAYAADHGHFLYFDQALLGAALRLGGGGHADFSGILFRPTVHHAAIGSPPHPAERRRDRIKALLYRCALRHPRMAVLFSLDPYFPAFALSHYHGGGKVVALPDPAPALPIISRRHAPSAGSAPIRMLLFGVLAERKGVLAALDALALLREKAARRIEVIFAGQIAEDCRTAFFARLERLRGQADGASIVVYDHYLTDVELSRLVAEADIILAPYQRHVGSSGALYWAAAAGKPVIAQDYGLVGRLVRDFQLGVTCDTTNPVALAATLEQAVGRPPSALCAAAGQHRFLEGHTPKRFAEILIGTILDRTASTRHLSDGRNPNEDDQESVRENRGGRSGTPADQQGFPFTKEAAEVRAWAIERAPVLGSRGTAV